MTQDQIILFAILAGVLGLLLSGRIRYDLVAFSALLIAVMSGVVSGDDAFSGFGHPATVIIAIVLVVSRGLFNSGAIEYATALIGQGTRSLSTHIAMVGGVGAALSAVMNNVAALALLMPVEIQQAQKQNRSPSATLMPLSFATILGGLITLIGTPPNIIIAQFRETELGEPFKMLDFAPVGLACAIAGLAFIAFIGWRLIPDSVAKRTGAQELFETEGYVSELLVPEGSTAIGQLVRELEPVAEEHEVIIVGLVRNGRRRPGRALSTEVRTGDLLVIEAAPSAMDAFVAALKLSYAKKGTKLEASDDMVLAEAVITENSRFESRSSDDVGLRNRYKVMLLGVAREGKKVRDRVRRMPLRAGDVVLLYGDRDRVDTVIQRFGCLPLANRGLKVAQRDKAGLAIGIFVAAIVLASFGIVYLPVALAAAAALMVFARIIPLREVYDSIEWPVIVLLGSLIPIGAAFDETGGTALIAEGIVTATEGLPGWVILTVLLVVTMTLSDVLNNTATTIIAAPIAVQVATAIGANPDPFLMAVAVGASCAFLTPIGHKNNTLVMGPGGYAFGDYWRMGLPLEIVVTAVAVPAILIFWPL